MSIHSPELAASEQQAVLRCKKNGEPRKWYIKITIRYHLLSLSPPNRQRERRRGGGGGEGKEEEEEEEEEEEKESINIKCYQGGRETRVFVICYLKNKIV